MSNIEIDNITIGKGGKMDRQKLMGAWKEFVESLHPDLWVTITFRTPTSKYFAKMRFKKFFKHLNKPNETFYSKFILCWVFFEEWNRQERCHIHALIKGIDPSLAVNLEEKCLREFGLSVIRPYDYAMINHPASEYLAKKYVFYYGSDYLERFTINSRLRKISKVYNKKLYEENSKNEISDASESNKSQMS